MEHVLRDWVGCFVEGQFGLIQCENVHCGAPVVVYGFCRTRTWAYHQPMSVWCLHLVCPHCHSVKSAYWQKDFHPVPTEPATQANILEWLGIEDPFGYTQAEAVARVRSLMTRYRFPETV